MGGKHIREEIADLLKLGEEERQHLSTVSITHLVSSLIEYTKVLENGYSLKEKNEMGLAEFILKFKKSYLHHLQEYLNLRAYDKLILEGKIIERAVNIFDEIQIKKRRVTERDLLEQLQQEKDRYNNKELLKQYFL